MATYVSTRIETAKKTKGQAGHDFDGRPDYADKEKKHLNKTVYGGSERDVRERIDAQAKAIKNRYNEQMAAEKIALKASGATAKELRACGGWRKNTATHWKSVVTFGGDFGVRDKPDRKLDRDKMDDCAKKHFESFCKKHGCELTYIVRHDDEETVHYHAMFTNLGYKREPLEKGTKFDPSTERFDHSRVGPLRFEMRHLSALQSDVGDQFAAMGMVRGKLRNARLEQARNENPIFENENMDEYNKRIYKIANVTNRNTSKLHNEQEADLRAKREKLEAENARLVAKNITLNKQINAEKLEIRKLKKSNLKKDIGEKYEFVTGTNILGVKSTETGILVNPKIYNHEHKILDAQKQAFSEEKKEQERERKRISNFKKSINKLFNETRGYNERTKSGLAILKERNYPIEQRSSGADRTRRCLDQLRTAAFKKQQIAELARSENRLLQDDGISSRDEKLERNVAMLDVPTFGY